MTTKDKTKQEEIREGVDKVLDRPIGISVKEIGDRQNTIYIDSNSREELKQELLKELDSQDVVIKVDREFPEHILPEATDAETASYNQGYLNGQVTMLEAGYVAVEPLIED